MATDSAFTVTKASDYATLAKQYAGPNQKKSVWEEYFLEPTQQYYQQQAQAVKDIASYDISRAYANYQKQQLQLMNQPALASGFKTETTGALKSAYEQQAQQIRASEQTQLAKVQEGYSSALGEIEGTFSQYGETAKQFEEAMLQYGAGKGLIDLSDTKKLYTAISEGGYGLYEQTFEDGVLTTSLTDYGRNLYDQILHSQQYSRDFAQYLSENQPELYEAYTQNQDLYNAIVAGMDYGDRVYDYEQGPMETYTKETISTLGGNYEQIMSLYPKDLAKDKAAMDKVIEGLTRTKDYVDSTGAIQVTNRYGKNYATAGSSHRGASGTVWYIKKQMPSGITWIGRDLEGDYKAGDVIYKDGEYLMITTARDGKAHAVVVEKR